MTDSEKECDCGHECHRDKDCEHCVNDVCFKCNCDDCKD